jgi:hypothetical protein
VSPRPGRIRARLLLRFFMLFKGALKFISRG